jgi:hypothetical protein
MSEIVQAQNNLHAALEGRQIDGWKVLVPRPLYVSNASSALVMTAVPGQSIGLYTAADAVTPHALADAACAFAIAMEAYWSAGQRHGDLNFGNVLFDLSAKKISLIDAGTRADCRVCCGTQYLQPTAVGDLAHLLWEMATDLKDLVRHQAVGMSNEVFTEHVLRTIIDRIRPREAAQQFLDQIWKCAQDHLANQLDLEWSRDWVRNKLVRQIAMRRIRSVLDRVRSHLELDDEAEIEGSVRAHRAFQS